MTLPIVILARYSTEMQNPKSCADQERDIRTALLSRSIQADDALVVHEDAQSGTRSDRAGFEQILEMIARRDPFLLVVDDQARFSRSDNVYSVITDLVYIGGRFISTGEGLDTDQIGWELRVKVMELHNSTTIRELGRRVHRGQLGRVLDDKSAGDSCFGYESYFLDPNWHLQVLRGPKPVKGLRINEEQARWVRQIFEWFVVDMWSINRIARELTARGVEKGLRSKGRAWHAVRVRQILENEKYIGKWRWGKTRVIRNSKGTKKQIPVPEKKWAVRDRPQLRIVSDALWDKAQKRLAELHDRFGHKPGQRARGPRVHHSVMYPQGLLRGLVVCGICKRRMWQKGMGGKYFLVCPDHGEGPGLCPMCTRIPLKAAEDAVLKLLSELLLSWPEWIARANASMRAVLERHLKAVPQQLAEDKKRLEELERKIEVILNELEDSVAGQSDALKRRLAQREAEAADLRRLIAEIGPVKTDVEVPDDDWVRQQLADLSPVLQEDKGWAGLLLRQLVGSIEAHGIIGAGKKRGYAQLRFRLRPWQLLMAAIDGRIPERVAQLVGTTGVDGDSPEFTIDLGAPSRMESWAPKIAEMRAKGIPWKKIVEITGMNLGPAYEAWKRYVNAMTNERREEGPKAG